MGIPIRPPREIGILCPGFPIPVQTPTFMYAYFIDIITCPGRPEAPNGQTFKLSQNPIFPCRWRNTPTVGPWNVELLINPLGLFSDLLLFRGGSAYLNVRNAGLVVEYKSYNDGVHACTPLLFGHSGTGFIFWLDVVAQQVLDLNLPVDGDGLFLESFFVSDTDKVNRYANTTYGLNKKLLFSP